MLVYIGQTKWEHSITFALPKNCFMLRSSEWSLHEKQELSVLAFQISSILVKYQWRCREKLKRGVLSPSSWLTCNIRSFFFLLDLFFFLQISSCDLFSVLNYMQDEDCPFALPYSIFIVRSSYSHLVGLLSSSLISVVFFCHCHHGLCMCGRRWRGMCMCTHSTYIRT